MFYLEESSIMRINVLYPRKLSIIIKSLCALNISFNIILLLRYLVVVRESCELIHYLTRFIIDFFF